MTDWWARLTRGRAVSRKTLRREAKAARDAGWADGREVGHVEARLQRYATPEVVASDNLTGAAGMAVWDDKPEPEVAP